MAGRGRVVFDAERFEHGRDPIDRAARFGLDARGDLPDAVGAEIGFAAEHRIRNLRLVRLGVRATAEQARFLVRERDHADRAARTFGQLRNQVRRAGRDADAGRVVDRSGARIPGIEVATHDEIFVGLFAAGEFRDHVRAGIGAVRAAIEFQLHREALAALQDAFDLVRVGIGQRRGRNRGHAVLETGDAGVRGTVVIGAGRAQQKAGRTLGRGDRRAARAYRGTDAVVVAVAMRAHARTNVHDLAAHAFRCGRLQRVEACERDDFGGQPAGRRGRRSAEGADREWLRKRCDDLGALAAALPLRPAHRFRPYLVEAERLELRDHPLACLEIIRTAGEARADLGGQALGEVPRRVVVQGELTQVLGTRDVGIPQAGCGIRGQRRRRDDGAGKQGETGGQHAHGRLPIQENAHHAGACAESLLT